jgi:hypothetical protein
MNQGHERSCPCGGGAMMSWTEAFTRVFTNTALDRGMSVQEVVIMYALALVFFLVVAFIVNILGL